MLLLNEINLNINKKFVKTLNKRFLDLSHNNRITKNFVKYIPEKFELIKLIVIKFILYITKSFVNIKLIGSLFRNVLELKCQ